MEASISPGNLKIAEQCLKDSSYPRKIMKIKYQIFQRKNGKKRKNKEITYHFHERICFLGFNNGK